MQIIECIRTNNLEDLTIELRDIVQVIKQFFHHTGEPNDHPLHVAFSKDDVKEEILGSVLGVIITIARAFLNGKLNNEMEDLFDDGSKVQRRFRINELSNERERRILVTRNRMNEVLLHAVRSNNVRVYNTLKDQMKKMRIIKDNGVAFNNNQPLKIACEMGHLKMVKYLVVMGADVEADGWTPLYNCCVNGHYDVAMLLEPYWNKDAEYDRTDYVDPLEEEYEACGYYDDPELMWEYGRSRRTESTEPYVDPTGRIIRDTYAAGHINILLHVLCAKCEGNLMYLDDDVQVRLIRQLRIQREQERENANLDE